MQAGHHSQAFNRWLVLIVLCLGVLMIVLDTTIVNVALPSIRADLGFSETSLVWVVNAYMLTFGGFLLLSGRMGDFFGQRRLFLVGIAAFTAASLVCGLATTQQQLVWARAVQGLGGAVVTAMALSLIMKLFNGQTERAKAMGVYGFVCAGGGSLGVLLGGVLTSLWSWHWIFLVNLPIGVLVYGLCMRLLPAHSAELRPQKLDIGGAISITTAMMLTVYAIVNGNEAGWASTRTLGLFALAGMLLVVFIVLQLRVTVPLMPLSLFRKRNMSVANVVAVLWAAALFAWFFMAALYMQFVLQYDALQVGLAFLPANVVMALFSLGISAWLVLRIGVRHTLIAGLVFAALGLGWFARAPLDGGFVADILPAMVLLGLGGGMVFNPLLLVAMNDVAPKDSGLASGMVNTAFMMGGAVGLAGFASVAGLVSQQVLAQGEVLAAALLAGYRLAFLLGAVTAVIGAGLVWLLMREPAAGQQQTADVQMY